MRCKLFLAYLILLVIFFLTSMAAAQTSCFKSETRELAERKAKVWQEPDPGILPNCCGGLVGYEQIFPSDD